MASDDKTSRSAASLPESSLQPPRTIGFPKHAVGPAVRAASASQARNTAAPTAGSAAVSASLPATRRIPTSSGPPTKNRPKGRVFISLVIITLIGSVGTRLWNEFLRYQAYGTIDGRVVRIAAPWAGVVQSLHAKDGQYVQPGQLLATLNNTELNLRLGKLRDEILLAHASFEARVAELKASQREQAERALRVHVDYFELVSKFQAEKSKLDAFRSDYRRLNNLSSDRVVARGKVESVRFACEGQEARVAELKSAVARMKAGLDEATLSEEEQSLLRIEKSRLETLIAEWQRLVDYDELGELRAPVGGRIVRRHHFTGEYVSASNVLFELLEEGSIQAVLYVPQDKARRLTVGAVASLDVPPYSKQITFRVDRLGDQMVPAPPSLRRYYRAGAQLVTVHASPLPGQLRDTQGDFSMWLGAEVRMPRFGGWSHRDDWSQAVFVSRQAPD